MSVVCTDPHIRRIFEITLLDRVFALHATGGSARRRSGERVSETGSRRAPTDSIVVEFPATEGYRSVGRLVLGGLASRFELPVDRVEDLLLAVESLLAATASPATP